MRKVILLLLGLSLAGAASANDSFNSEFSHCAGNYLLAGASTLTIDKYWPEVKHPANAGFAISTVEVLLGEILDSRGRFSMLDATSGTAGAALGAWSTGKWLVAPQVHTESGHVSVGIGFTHRF